MSIKNQPPRTDRPEPRIMPPNTAEEAAVVATVTLAEAIGRALRQRGAALSSEEIAAELGNVERDALTRALRLALNDRRIVTTDDGGYAAAEAGALFGGGTRR